MKVAEIQAKSILVSSKLPDADYVINPYTGCQFGCLYCYATFTGRYVQESRDDWGNYVYAKVNSVDVLREQLRQLSPQARTGSILLSSVTDPYQGVEEKYRLTRGILEVLVEEQYLGRISILTKSPLVLRDIDLFRQLHDIEVGMTITTTDDTLSRFLEVTAPLASRRFDTLSQLHSQGIAVYSFIGPLLPHFRFHPDKLDELLQQVAATGVKEVYVEHINLPTYIKERLWKTIHREPEEIQKVYQGAETPSHRQILSETVQRLLTKYGLKLRLSEVLYHQESNSLATKTNDADVRALINAALARSGAVRIGYEDSNGNITERVIAPLEWSDFDERKITAYCYLRQDERQFVISRVRYAENAGLAADFQTIESGG